MSFVQSSSMRRWGNSGSISMRRCGIAKNEERIAKVKLMGKPMWLNNAKKGIKKRRKRGIWVKLIFGGTWSTGSNLASTWSAGATQMVLGLRGATQLVLGVQLILRLWVGYMAGTQSTMVNCWLVLSLQTVQKGTEGYGSRNYLVPSLQQMCRWYIGHWK